MCEPAVRSLRELFPQAEIILLARPAIAELFSGHPALDRLMIYDSGRRHAGFAGKWLLASELRKLRIDVAILFQNAFEAALIMFMAGIPHRYGYATDCRSWLLTRSIPAPDRASLRHHIQYYLDLLRPLGASGTLSPPQLFVSKEEEREMERRLAGEGFDPSDFLIGLNPGSTYGNAKRWMPERFAETAERLVARYGGGVVIVGAPGEEALGQQIAGAMRVKSLVLSGRTSIRQLMAAIKRCSLFLTNDTGPMHIAAAFGIPVVAVFGPTDARDTSPFGTPHVIVRQPVDCSPCLLRECPIDHRCMVRVTPDHVYTAAVRLIAESAERRMPTLGNSPFNEAQRAALGMQHWPLKGVTVFLDRDGTVNRDTGYVKSPEELELLPGVVESIARLKRAGARVVIVTNQSGVARGLVTLEQLKAIHARLRALLEAGGAGIDALYYCPHHPDEGCACRKPQTGMVERAVSDLRLDLTHAYVVGDQKRDIELARRVGARSVLVTTGPTSLEALDLLVAENLAPDRIASSLVEAVDWILEDALQKKRSALSNQRSAS